MRAFIVASIGLLSENLYIGLACAAYCLYRLHRELNPKNRSYDKTN
jgi:hypothetical protein